MTSPAGGARAAVGFRPARQAARAARARGAAGARADPVPGAACGARRYRGARGARGCTGDTGAGRGGRRRLCAPRLLGLCAPRGLRCSPGRVLQGGEGWGDREGWEWRKNGTERDGDREADDREGRGPGGMATRGRLGGRPGSPTAPAGRGRDSRCRRRELRTGPAPQRTWGLSPTLPRPRCPLRPPRPGLGLRIHPASRCGAPWGSPESQPAAPSPPHIPGAPRLSEGGDVTGGGAWGAGGKGVRARGPRVAAGAGWEPSSPLFVEPPRPQSRAPLQTRILLIATPPKSCSVTPVPCARLCLQMPPENLQQL